MMYGDRGLKKKGRVVMLSKDKTKRRFVTEKRKNYNLLYVDGTHAVKALTTLELKRAIANSEKRVAGYKLV